MKKFVTTLCVAVGISSLLSISALAESEGGISGGWSEDTGYYINNNLSSYSIQATSTSTEPESHTATIEYREYGSSALQERVTGTTVWSGVYHYTRARYEDWLSDNVYGDSGRVYDWDYTTATSDWVVGDFATAKTYWGR